MPKLSALRILDEVAKLKQAQSTVKQTEERMDNVHMVRRPKPSWMSAHLFPRVERRRR